MVKTSLKKMFSLSKVFAMSVAFFATSLLLSCSVIEENVKENENEQSYTLSGNISNYAEIENVEIVSGNASSNGARTIFPDTASGNLSNFNFYLYGKASNRVLFKSITISGGKFSENLTSAYWQLTLYAVSKTLGHEPTMASIDKEALYAGRCVVDMLRSSASVEFVLSPEGLKTPATMNLSLKFANNGVSWTPSDLGCASIYAEIQDRVTCEAVSFIIGGIAHVPLALSGITKFGSDTTTILPGDYELVVAFFDSSNALIGRWSNSLLVLAGRSYTSTINIPNIIGEKPAAPALFSASIVANSQDNSNDRYKVLFKWENTPNNELYYEMELLSLETLKTNDHTTYGYNFSSDTYWNSFSETYRDTMNRDCFARGDYVDGSLDANSEELTLWLPFEKRYWARIRSVNKAGSSAWTYVTFDSLTINQFRVIYDFNGGTYSQTPTASRKVEYYSQNDPNPANLTPITYFSPAAGTLTRGGKAFLGWSESNSTFTAVTPYKDYKNKTLYAWYEE